ncbi:MAG TPA: glycosyltransferase family 9 protein [Thermomicrobiales bacterium]|nr:glycosyltransferase family 9 protein [Thermomicrobiales bacterium]
MQEYGAIVPDVRRIAVLRANAIGDFVFTLPALEAVRAAYPDAEIVLLGRPWHESFLKNRPSPVDRVIPVPPCRGVGEPEDFVNDEAVLDRFFASMAGERFDLALQLHGGGRFSNPFVQRLNADLTAGLKAPEAPALDRWIPYIYFQTEIVRFLETVALVGAKPVTLEPQIVVTEADLAESRQAIPDDDDNKPLVVIHPGAGDPRRRWPTQKFAAIGDALAAKGARVVVIGAWKDERPLVEAVVEEMTAAAIPLWDRLSLGGLAGLLSRCDLIVSNDSGPLHVAAAVGAPTVGIYWCFNLVTAGSLTRARHRPVSSWRLECPVCGVNSVEGSCEHRESFVADVPVEEVLAQALDLLDAAPR